MKRIVFAVTNDLSYDQRMHRICQTLQDAGYQVELLGRHRKKSVALMQKAYTQKRLRCWFEKGPLFYAEYNLRLFVMLLCHRAEIFGACDLDTALAVCLAGKFRRRKMIFDAHEHFAEVPEVERRKIVKAIWHTIGRWCIPKFHVRYTVGESLARILEEIYQAPFSVVRNVPNNTNVEILPFAQREKLIVYQGALNEGRGLVQIIEAMKMLPDMKLRLIGEGDLSLQLRDMTAKLGLFDRVEFAGYILPKDLYSLNRNAMFGCNLLEERSKSYFYSLANKFFDYMHAGVPSLNMMFPEYQEIIKKHPVGICIEKLSADAIADAIQRMSADSIQMKNMVETCQVARDIYCWQKEQNNLLALISLLAS